MSVESPGYFGLLVAKYPKAVKAWVDGGLAGRDTNEFPDRYEFANVIKHQILVAAIVQETCSILKLSKKQKSKVVEFALGHDADKRVNKRGTREIEIETETKKDKYLERTTTTNFSTFSQWDILEKILRFADSSVMDVNYRGQMVADIVSWQKRIADLKKRKPDEDDLGVTKFGQSTFERLGEITEQIEKELYDQALTKNESLVSRYSDHSYLTQILKDKIEVKIKAKSDYDRIGILNLQTEAILKRILP